MKAFVIDRFGGPEVMSERTLPVPKPKHNEVLVKVNAVSINPMDVAMRGGYAHTLIKLRRPQMPWILGRDCSGIVVDVGSNVLSVRRGDEVFAAVHPFDVGTFSEYVSIPQHAIAKKPKNVSDSDATAFAYAGLTAWQSLIDSTNLSQTISQNGNKKLFINGGGGGLGLFGIQLAKKYLGCGTVAVTCGANALDTVRKFGADVAIDYKTQNFSEILSDYDVVLDTVGGEETERKCASILRRGSGILTSVRGPLPSQTDALGLLAGLSTGLIQIGNKIAQNRTLLGVDLKYVLFQSDGKTLSKIGELASVGILHSIIDPRRKFSGIHSIPSAMAAQESGGSCGKIVVEF